MSDNIALIDLDGTVADYDAALTEAMKTLQAPDEPSYQDRYTGGVEPSYIEARRKMIQRQPGFWRNLKPLQLGFDVVDEFRRLEFGLHVLTKGPRSTPNAWGEKLEWCTEHMPDALVTVSSDKSLVYGRALVDDYPDYFMGWLRHRPRGLVVCVAHPWNEGFRKGGRQENPNVFRYDGTNRKELSDLVRRVAQRKSGESL